MSLPGTSRICVRAASSDDTVDAACGDAPGSREGIRSRSAGWARVAPTTDENYQGDVKLSPSQFERALACPLRWFLTTIGADGPSNAAASLGTLVHARRRTRTARRRN